MRSEASPASPASLPDAAGRLFSIQIPRNPEQRTRGGFDGSSNCITNKVRAFHFSPVRPAELIDRINATGGITYTEVRPRRLCRPLRRPLRKNTMRNKRRSIRQINARAATKAAKSCVPQSPINIASVSKVIIQRLLFLCFIDQLGACFSVHSCNGAKIAIMKQLRK